MKTINGHQLKQMVISGANNLFNCYPDIDALNVFPVPDGDTGTNMNLTMTSGSKEILNINDGNIHYIAKSFSRGLLMGARGNSGVILSQIFRGFSMHLEGKESIDVFDFALAWTRGSEVAYKAVMRPVEGTILTVIRESAAALKAKAESLNSIEEAMKYLIEEANASLKRTPDLLPILKEVGVVDSGGAGLVKVLDGFLLGLEGNVIERKQISVMDLQKIDSIASSLENEEYGYCTEFILRLGGQGKKPFKENRMASTLEGIGNSIVVVQDEDIVKVHVHTLKPGAVLNYAQLFGEFVTLKVENMQEQHGKLIEEGKSPLIQEKKEYALIAVSSGKGLDKMFADLRVNQIVSGGQTMNPSTEDFVEAIKNANAKEVYILPNNSNIIMAAQQAVNLVEDVIVHVIPTKTVPQGMVACMMFNPEEKGNVNVEEMNAAIANVATGQITFAIKDTTVDGIEIREGHFIGIREKNIVCCEKDKLDSAKKLVDYMVTEDNEIVTLIYGEDVKEIQAKEIASYIEEKTGVEVEIYNGGQPVYSFILGVE